MKKSSIQWLIVLVAILSLVGCAPKAAPFSPPKTTPTQASPKSAAPAPDASMAEWAKVEEAAKKEGKITAFTWGFAGTPGDKIVDVFKNKYGIEIERVTGLTPTLIERIKTDSAAGRYVVDLFDAAPSSAYALKAAGLTEPMAAQLPVLKEKGVYSREPFWDTEGHMVLNSGSGYGIGINTKLVPPGQEPKSWRELLDPKWTGKVVFASPTTAPDLINLYVVKEKLGLDDNYFRQLGKQARVAPTGRDAAGLLSRGETYIWIPGSSSMAAPMVMEGAPIKLLTPSEGAVHAGGTTMVRIKNAPHPNATRFFMNWLLTAEGNKIISDARGSMPARKDFPNPQPEAARLNWDKGVYQQIEDVMAISKIQTEKTLSKIMSVE